MPLRFARWFFRLGYDIEPSRKTYVPRTWDRQTDERIANVHSITLLISMGLQQVLDDTRSLSYLLYHQKGRLTRPSRYGDELHSLAGICKKTLVRTTHNVANEHKHGMFSVQGTHFLGFSYSLQALFTVNVRGLRDAMLLGSLCMTWNIHVVKRSHTHTHTHTHTHPSLAQQVGKTGIKRLSWPPFTA